MNHTIFNKDIDHDQPSSIKSVIFGAGCFWGVERKFWSLSGVVMTSVGYAGGDHDEPSYELVCAGITGHAEVVKVDYDPTIVSLMQLLKIFWECHDPTQGDRQGNDRGTQYRSVIFCEDEEDLFKANDTKKKYQAALKDSGFNEITTEVKIFNTYYLAEEYHQQYLAKNPNGYCGVGGTNCPFPNN